MALVSLLRTLLRGSFPINAKERSQVTKLGDLDVLLFLFCGDLGARGPWGGRAAAGLRRLYARRHRELRPSTVFMLEENNEDEVQ